MSQLSITMEVTHVQASIVCLPYTLRQFLKLFRPRSSRRQLP